MLDQTTLLERARALAARRRVALTTISKNLFGDWRRLDSIASGSYLRPPTLARALERLDALERETAAREATLPVDAAAQKSFPAQGAAPGEAPATGERGDAAGGAHVEP